MNADKLVISLVLVSLAMPLAASQSGGPGGGSGTPDPIAGLNLTVEPAGAIVLAPGATAHVQLDLRNGGNASLQLTVMAFAGGAFGGQNGGAFNGTSRGGNGTFNGTSRDGNGTFNGTRGNRTGGGFGGRDAGDVVVTLDSPTGTVDPGATGTDGLTLAAASNATAGARTLTILVREDGTNHTAFLRVPVQISAPATSQTQASDAGRPAKRVPLPGLGPTLAFALAFALALRRRAS